MKYLVYIVTWLEYYTYKTYIAPHTIVGDRIIERIQLKRDADAFLKKYETETTAYKQQIEELTQTVQLKEALIQAYARGNKV